MICLAGFMGSGKTTIGTLLARQLAWRFVDLDERIEEAFGLRIPDIFERFGEPKFRQIEAEQLRAVLGRTQEMNEAAVVALGGGTYAQAGAAEFLRSSGIPVFWLDASVEVLLSRCMTMTGRPLFRDEESFRALHAQRLPFYQLADYRMDSSRDPALVVSEICGIVSSLTETRFVVEKPQP